MSLFQNVLTISIKYHQLRRFKQNIRPFLTTKPLSACLLWYFFLSSSWFPLRWNHPMLLCTPLSCVEVPYVKRFQCVFCADLLRWSLPIYVSNFRMYRDLNNMNPLSVLDAIFHRFWVPNTCVKVILSWALFIVNMLVLYRTPALNSPYHKRHLHYVDVPTIASVFSICFLFYFQNVHPCVTSSAIEAVLRIPSYRFWVSYTSIESSLSMVLV